MGQNQRNGWNPVGAFQKIKLPWANVELPWQRPETHGELDMDKLEQNFVALEERLGENHYYLDRVDWGSGVGTRWRTIVIAASNTIEPGKSGADFICPGSNDQVMINTAISYLTSKGASQNIGRIVLLEGTYSCSDSINILAPGGRHLAIEGMSGQAQSNLSIAGVQINNTSSTAAVFNIAGAGGDVGGTVTIENVAVRCASVVGSGVGAITSRDVTLHVRNCRVECTSSAHGIAQTNSTGGSSNTIIDGNFVTTGANAFGITISDGPTRPTVSYVRNNTVNIGAGGKGIVTGNDLSSTPAYHINDNTIYGGGNADSSVGIQCSGTSTQNNVVSDNFIFKCQVAIAIAGYKNIVANNLSELAGTGIKGGAFQLDSSFIVGNNIIDPTTCGIEIGTQNCTRNGILGNKIVGYNTTVPVGVQINSLAVSTHVYYNDFDSGVTSGLVDTGTGTSSQSGIPSGGTTGQILAKHSSGAGDVQWVDDDVKAAMSAAGDLIAGLGAGTYGTLHKSSALPMGPTWSQRVLVDTGDPLGVKWGPLISVTNVAPTSPQPGDIWLDTT